MWVVELAAAVPNLELGDRERILAQVAIQPEFLGLEREELGHRDIEIALRQADRLALLPIQRPVEDAGAAGLIGVAEACDPFLAGRRRRFEEVRDQLGPIHGRERDQGGSTGHGRACDPVELLLGREPLGAVGGECVHLLGAPGWLEQDADAGHGCAVRVRDVLLRGGR